MKFFHAQAKRLNDGETLDGNEILTHRVFPVDGVNVEFSFGYVQNNGINRRLEISVTYRSSDFNAGAFFYAESAEGARQWLRSSLTITNVDRKDIFFAWVKKQLG